MIAHCHRHRRFELTLWQSTSTSANSESALPFQPGLPHSCSLTPPGCRQLHTQCSYMDLDLSKRYPTQAAIVTSVAGRGMDGVGAAIARRVTSGSSVHERALRTVCCHSVFEFELALRAMFK